MESFDFNSDHDSVGDVIARQLVSVVFLAVFGFGLYGWYVLAMYLMGLPV